MSEEESEPPKSGSKGLSFMEEDTYGTCPVGESSCHIIDEVQRLRELVRVDSLTGLFSFRHFRYAIEQEMERTRRSGLACSLIMVDLDYFKAVNDTWGHEVGNIALRKTATAIKESLRKLDIPCRYGGEEFAVILPSTELLIATQVAERLRRVIAGLLVDTGTEGTGTEKITVTASMGVSVYIGTGSAEDLIRRADNQLYCAKTAGRNRVCHDVDEQVVVSGHVSSEEKSALYGLFSNEEKNGDKKSSED